MEHPKSTPAGCLDSPSASSGSCLPAQVLPSHRHSIARDVIVDNVMVGCRAGSACPYRHVQAAELSAESSQKHGSQKSEARGDPAVPGEQLRLPSQARNPFPRTVPSQKPVSQLQESNPREFQLAQVIRRFAPTRKEYEDDTTLSLMLAPTDPDFPFDLVGGLRCDLAVPKTYPQNGKPTVRVTNAEMPRGFQINVERGFDMLVANSPQKTLLALLNDLDRNLEQFLTTDKAQTIKIIANADKRPKLPAPEPERTRDSAPAVPVAPVVPSWTPQQTSHALNKRKADVRQIEARMGRLPGFAKASDGTSFNIPVSLPKPSRLPVNLQSLREVTLLVPKLYNLEPCTILLNGVSGPEVEHVQLAFERHVRSNKEMTLMAHVNFLTQNIHTLVVELTQNAPPAKEVVQTSHRDVEPAQRPQATKDASEGEREIVDEDRPHLHFIPRPPEWDKHDSDESSDDSDDYSDTGDEEDTEDEDEAEEGGANLPTSTLSTSTEKGIHLSFPNLELHNIELLTIDSLSLSVKCLRCKTVLAISKIKASRDSDGSTASSTRTESCSKCTTPFTLSFTANALHTNTVRAGVIEATGCTISDMLPSIFQPTCSSCSTTFAVPPGMISVRGDTPIQVCRSCHAKMTFTIHEVKFLRVSHASATLPLRRPKKENLGISAGTPLPNNGTCPHYRHSYRWFRFSCCNRVYPCDRCHEAAEEHVNEHADRMVCGWCSREQRFRTEDCGICGRSVMRRKKVGGFWEGGQGTRDRKLMRRNEKRKYKRPSAKEAAAMQGKKN